jgi:hypothetical protein
MSEAKFKIGDRVKPNVTDGEGTVFDAMHSPATGWTYEVKHDSGANFFFREKELDPVTEKRGYRMTIRIDVASNVVIATLFEVAEPNMRPIAKGHGHLIHEGANGVAQAASYACKKLYENLGGTITKGSRWK